VTATVRLTNVRVWDTNEVIDIVAPLPCDDSGGEVDGPSGRSDQSELRDRNASDMPSVIDGTGLVVSPGLVDVHVHFRDPGQTDKEDMVSGSAAAAAGGFTDVCLQPNTLPAADGEPLHNDRPVSRRLLKQGFISVLDYLELYEEAFGIRLPINYTVAVAASRGREGNEPSRPEVWKPFLREGEADAGHPVVAISDDGSAVTDSLLDPVLNLAKDNGLFLMEHCEHHETGVINDGETARRLGVAGVPASTEMDIVSRDIAAAQRTGVHVHLQHVSTAAAFEAVRKAKAAGIPITCETAPHYFSLRDTDVEKYGSMAKMNPPLRSEEDRQATLAALADGTVDVIATDHAPHTPEEKGRGLRDSPNGIIGLETSYALANTFLVESGLMTHQRLIDLMSLAPARLVGLERTDISELLQPQEVSRSYEPSQDSALVKTQVQHQAPANTLTHRVLDLTAFPQVEANLSLLAPHAEWTVDANNFASKARNTPFDGWKLTGRPVATIVRSQLQDVAGILRKGTPWTD
jgi:dihydroorotase